MFRYFIMGLLISSSVKAASINSEWMKSAGECAGSSTTPPAVILIKQWHLTPSSNTKLDKRMMQSYPQYKNQKNIYLQLEQWVKNGKLDALVAEGCAGKVDSIVETPFNGWDYSSLQEKAHESKFDDIITHVGLKLEAKYKGKMHVLCGDDLDQIKNGQLALSDVRGDLGYLTRLIEYRDQPEKVKTYLDGAIEILKLPAATTVAQATEALKKDLKASLDHAMKSIEARNARAVEVALAANSKNPVVIVYGGVHIPGIKELLEKKKASCEVLEPVGYAQDDEKMLKDVHDLLTN